MSGLCPWCGGDTLHTVNRQKTRGHGTRTYLVCRYPMCDLELTGPLERDGDGEYTLKVPRPPMPLHAYRPQPRRVPTTEWLDEVGAIVRPRILEHFTRDSCTTSSRIGLHILNLCGVLAVPEPVEILAFTHDRHKAMNAGVRPEDLPGWAAGCIGTDEVTPAAQRTDGRDGVSNGRGWQGHLVIRTEPVGDVAPMLWDLSVDQLDRPEHNMRVPGPIACEVPDLDAWQRGEWMGMFLETTVVTYKYAPNLKNWQHMATWVRHDATLTMIVAWSMREIAKMPLLAEA